MKTSHKQKLLWFIVLSIGLLIPMALPVSAEEGRNVGGGTIDFWGDDGPITQVDPEEPDEPVDPGEGGETSGQLRLDYVPHLRFGTKEMSGDDSVHYVHAQNFHDDDTSARPNYIQISDLRGKLSGWSITVKQDMPFTLEGGKETLKGAVLSFDKHWTNSNISDKYKPTIKKDAIEITEHGASYPIVRAEKGKGGGTWTINFGSTGEEGTDQPDTIDPLHDEEGEPVIDKVYDKWVHTNSAIKLHIPGKGIPKPGKYKTMLTWTLSELT